ncbi:MAG: hypothetical protein KGI06_05530 [Candidatus Micrarchaeota archaeon]|nr:hypothetical protein [Candidatus Micrarchaeota archaeon]
MQRNKFVATVASLSVVMLLLTTSVVSAASFNFNFKSFKFDLFNGFNGFRSQLYNFFVNPINKPGNGPKPCNPGHFGYACEQNTTTTIFECNKGTAGDHNPHCTNSST